MKILIDNGDVFEGNQEQFEDCFFSNATKDQIIDWCKHNDFTYEFIEEVPGRDKENEYKDDSPISSTNQPLSDIFEAMANICKEFNKNIPKIKG